MKDCNSTGLTMDQADELGDLIEQYGEAIGPLKTLPPTFGDCVLMYLRTLWLHAEMERFPKRFGRSMAKLRKERAPWLRRMANDLRRQPSADDLLQQLGRFVAVPEFVARAIRDDLRLIRSERQ